MPDVIPFPGSVRALGFTFPAAVLAAGIAAAEGIGIDAGQVAAVLAAGIAAAEGIGIDAGQVAALMEDDRPFAVYFLSHLGSADEQDQRVGEFGLHRLLDTLESAACSPSWPR